MQATPALPWGSTVEGGVIQFNQAFTKEDLLAQRVVPVFDVENIKTLGSIREEASDQLLYIFDSNSSRCYKITNTAFPTNELILERTNSLPRGTMLQELEISNDNVLTNPKLPWPVNGQGDLNFKEPITFNELVRNLTLEADFGSTDPDIHSMVGELVQGTPDRIKYDYNSQTRYQIIAFEGETENVHVQTSGPSNFCKLVGVSLNNQH